MLNGIPLDLLDVNICWFSGLPLHGMQKLHTGGARFFFIFNQPAAGCTPYYLTLFSENSAKDEFGCLSAYNAVFQTLNHKLKAAVETYRQMWPETIFLYYDWYAGNYEVIQNQAKYGKEYSVAPTLN